MNYYDYIIVGGGASGLMMAYRMSNDPFFDDKSILILDKQKKINNDRTWCYWETEHDEWNGIVSASWKNIIFKSELHSAKESIAPYQYKMIRSKDFYSKIWAHLETKATITFEVANVLSIHQRDNEASVITDDKIFKTKTILNSILYTDSHKKQSKYPVLQQHFVGFFSKLRKLSLMLMLPLLWISQLLKKGIHVLCIFYPMRITKLCLSIPCSQKIYCHIMTIK